MSGIQNSYILRTLEVIAETVCCFFWNVVE